MTYNRLPWAKRRTQLTRCRGVPSFLLPQLRSCCRDRAEGRSSRGMEVVGAGRTAHRRKTKRKVTKRSNEAKARAVSSRGRSRRLKKRASLMTVGKQRALGGRAVGCVCSIAPGNQYQFEILSGADDIPAKQAGARDVGTPLYQVPAHTLRKTANNSLRAHTHHVSGVTPRVVRQGFFKPPIPYPLETVSATLLP